MQPGVDEVAAAAGADPLDLAAAGGEDYELPGDDPAGPARAGSHGARDAWRSS